MCQATVRSAATLARDRKEEQDIKRRAALRIARSSRELSITLDLSSFGQLLDDFKAFTFKHQATPLTAFVGTLVVLGGLSLMQGAARYAGSDAMLAIGSFAAGAVAGGAAKRPQQASTSKGLDLFVGSCLRSHHPRHHLRRYRHHLNRYRHQSQRSLSAKFQVHYRFLNQTPDRLSRRHSHHCHRPSSKNCWSNTNRSMSSPRRPCRYQWR